MPFINLIHEQRLQIRQREQQIRILTLVAFGVGSLAFLAVGFFLFNTARYQVMIGTLEAKKRALQPLIEQLEANERDQAGLEPKLTTLTNATKATEQWSKLMEHLLVNMPKSVWLTKIQTQLGMEADGGGVNVTFGGYSLNHDEIGEFLLRLESCQDLEGVTLRFSQERLVEKSNLLEFEIFASISGSKVTKKIKAKESA